MKKKLPLLLALAALGLAACGGGEASSSTSGGDAGSSDVSSSEPASSDPASSDNGTESASSSETPARTWTEDDLAIITPIVGDHELPYHDFAADGYTYTLAATRSGNLLLTIQNFAFDDIADAVATWTADGYVDNTSRYPNVDAGMSILDREYEDYSTIQAQFFISNDGGYNIATSGSGTFYLYIFPTISTNVWSEVLTDLNAAIDEYLDLGPLTAADFPEPKTHGYSIVTSVMDSSYNYYPDLVMYGVSNDDYLDELVTAGWNKIDGVVDSSYTYLASPDGSIGIIGEYVRVYNGAYLDLQFVANQYYTEWPAAYAAACVTALGAKDSPVVPAPTFDFDLAIAYDFYSSYGYYEIDVQSYDEAGTALVDTSTQYAALLNAENSGWTYDSVQEVWHNSESNVAVSIEFSSRYGLCIYIEPYSPLLTAWPTEDIASARTTIGMPTAATVVEYTGTATGYQFDIGTSSAGVAYYFIVNVLGVSATDAAAYETALKTAGYESSTYPVSETSSTTVWYNADGTIVVRAVYDSTAGTLTIAYYLASRTNWGAWYNNANVIINWFKQNDAGLSLSMPTIPAGTLGLTDISSYLEDKFYVGFYAFDTTFAAAYQTSLVAAGWVANAASAEYYGVTAFYTFTGTTYVWNLLIDVDETNNTTSIEIGAVSKVSSAS